MHMKVHEVRSYSWEAGPYRIASMARADFRTLCGESYVLLKVSDLKEK